MPPRQSLTLKCKEASKHWKLIPVYVLAYYARDAVVSLVAVNEYLIERITNEQ